MNVFLWSLSVRVDVASETAEPAASPFFLLFKEKQALPLTALH